MNSTIARAPSSVGLRAQSTTSLMISIFVSAITLKDPSSAPWRGNLGTFPALYPPFGAVVGI